MAKIVCLILFWKILFLSSRASALSMSCAEAILDKESYIGIELQDVFYKVPYRELSEQSNYELEILHPGWIENNEVAISIKGNGHPSIFFNGFRIDSQGHIGSRVVSRLTKGNQANGRTLFFIKHLPPDVVQNLKDLILNL